MEAHDAAFIRALRDNPDDETTRLAYTDWLDERGDSRVAYLRAEAAWAVLQSTNGQYRPLGRELSQLAAQLDPVWFASVSRVSHTIRAGWKAVSHLFTLAPPGLPELANTWKEAATRLRSLFAEAFGALEVERRFCLPADFVAFMCAVEVFNYSQSKLIEITEWHVQEFSPTKTAGVGEERALRPEMWFHFAEACDDSWFVVCCDLGSPLYGVVAEYSCEAHPWQIDQTGGAFLNLSGRNTIQFVTEYLASVYGPGPYRWPDVPFEQWATY